MKTRLTKKIAEGYLTKIWQKTEIMKELCQKSIEENIKDKGSFDQLRYIFEIKVGLRMIERDILNMQHEQDLV